MKKQNSMRRHEAHAKAREVCFSRKNIFFAPLRDPSRLRGVLLLLSLSVAACAATSKEGPPPAEVPDGGVVAPVAKPPPAAEKPAPTPPPAAEAQKAAPAAKEEPGLMPEQAFRDQKPAPLPVQPHFEAPVPTQHKLKNGARVLVVENHQVPLVAVDVRFLHGVDADPAAQPGLAEFVADTVDEGTKTRPAEKLAAEIEDLAAHLSAGAGLEGTSVHLNCLTETLPQALELMADVIQNPAFRPEDVERVRVLRLTALEQKRASIGALASDEASLVLYGPQHPWGKPSGGTPQSVQSIKPADLARFHDAFWVPNDAIISVSGDVTTAEVLKLLEQKFAGWKSRPLPKLKLPPFPRLTKRSIEAIDKPAATQSQVWVVGRLFKATDPDAIAMRVANLPLGGMFTSRLNMNLREQHGYSYGVFSGVSLMRSTGRFQASGGIVAKNTVDAVKEYEAELTKYSDGVISPSELAAAKEDYIRGLPSGLETNDAVSAGLSNLLALGLPLDYYRTLPSRIDAVTLADVKRVVTTWVRPDRWPIVIVGPVGKDKDALEKLDLGPVTVSPAK